MLNEKLSIIKNFKRYNLFFIFTTIGHLIKVSISKLYYEKYNRINSIIKQQAFLSQESTSETNCLEKTFIYNS
jgi:hypothetical protein